MSDKPNKGGRPARAPGERMTRLSVAVRPRYKDALEMIARDRRTSLSQALEYLIAKSARDYRIEGQSVMEMVAPGDDAVAVFEQLARASAAATGQSKGGLNERSLKLINMPASLRKPEENYYVELLDRAKHLMQPDDKMLDVSIQAYQAGISIEAMVETLENAKVAVADYLKRSRN